MTKRNPGPYVRAGEEFGRLTALADCPLSGMKVNGKQEWFKVKVQCWCGTEKIVRALDLRNGLKSCGCMRGSRDTLKGCSDKDYPIGSRWEGAWVVSTSVPYFVGIHGQRHSYVDLRCEYEYEPGVPCGTVFAAPINRLNGGKTRSCGCLNRARVSEAARSRVGERHHRWKGDDGKTMKLEWLRGEKSNPCIDCGERFPWQIMQFDHRDPSFKSFEVNASTCGYGKTLAELKVERAKCDLVCSNCHDWRTWLRKVGKPLVPLSQWDDSHDIAEREVALSYL